MKNGGYVDKRKEATRLGVKVANPIEARRAYAQIFAFFADEDSKRKHFADIPETCTYPMCTTNTRCVYGVNVSPEIQDSIEKLIEDDMQRFVTNGNPHMNPEIVAEYAKSLTNFRNIYGKGFYDTCTMGKLRELHGSEREIRKKLEARGNNNYKCGLKTAKHLISEGRAQLKSAEASASRADDMEFVGMYELSDEERESSGEKRNISIEKIIEGLEAYSKLITYENLPHFKRIKNAIRYTLEEFEKYIPAAVQERYHNEDIIKRAFHRP